MSRWKPQIKQPGRALFNGYPSRSFSHSNTRHSESPPSIAPKPSFNQKHIRQNPQLYSDNCLRRNYKSQIESPFEIVKLFDEWLQSQKSARGLREKGNAIQKQLSHPSSSSGVEAGDQDGQVEQKTQLLELAQDLKKQISTFEVLEREISKKMEDLAAGLPNLTSDETPLGKEPNILGYINEPDVQQYIEGHLDPSSPFSNKSRRDHVQISTDCDLVDFAGAATTSGWGWYFLKNEAMDLEHALVQYALKVARRHGFAGISPPSVVYTHIALACGFRPRDQNGEHQVYGIYQPNGDGEKDKPSLSLAGTAEIPFAGMKADLVLDQAELPIRVVGSSRCFRAEAGARGVDTKGLYRVHEFTKVEMFAWTAPGSEDETFTSMLDVQKEILQNLGLYCRVLEMPSTDLGASAFRKQDIEAFFPSRRKKHGGWGEVTSTSICTDYQTRRLNTRIRSPAGSRAKMEFPSTVNGTALAVPRVLAALLENGWDEKGQCVRIPEILWPWMHGVQVIKKKSKAG